MRAGAERRLPVRVTVDDRFSLREGGTSGRVPAGYAVASTPFGTRVDGPDGGRLLYCRSGGAPPLDGSPGPEAAGAPADADAGVVPPQQVDLAIVDAVGSPELIGVLRRTGVVGVTTAVVAVGGDHRVHSPAEFVRRARLWGALVPSDGQELLCPPAFWPPGRPRGPHRVLITGGARSGKSTEAERRLLGEPEVLYAATGPVPDSGTDPAWAERVKRHIERRPYWWRTEETPDAASVLEQARGAVLFDCVGTWLAGVLDACGVWEDDPPPGAEQAVDAAVEELVRMWRNSPAYIVAVTNEVGSGVVPATRAGGLFRDRLGLLNQRLGAESEEVVLVTAGRVLDLP